MNGRLSSTPRRPEYFYLERRELHAFVRDSGFRYEGHVLNVGCAAGADAAILRAAGASYIYGIEPNVEAASEARKQYDEVFGGSVQEWIWNGTRFDVILFADVLEHLDRPDEVLTRVRQWLRPEGRLVISVPNVRHVSVLWRLVVSGDWRYEGQGIMDATHLRFFTLRSCSRLLINAGFQPLAMRRWGSQPVTRALERVLPGTGEFLLSQVFIVAGRSDAS